MYFQKIPGQNFVSSIRLEKDGAQKLYKYNLSNGESEVLIDAISNYAETEEERTFAETTLIFWKEYETKIMEALQEQVKELEKEKKRKIDPTRIFNVRGEKNER